MTLPRKKSRTIVVQDEAWYWRTHKAIRMDEDSRLRFEESKRLAVEKNPELKGKRFMIMAHSGEFQYVRIMNLVATRKEGKPFMIKAEFIDCERLLPKVVAAVIAYALRHAKPSDKLFEIENATQLFEKTIAVSDEKENSLSKIRYAKYKQDTSQKHELEADRHISEGNLYKAIDELRSSIFYDRANHHKLRKLDNMIREDQASAKLCNHRAFTYYSLHKHDPSGGYLEKAYLDVAKALELDPECAIAYGTLAEILYAMGDTAGFYDKLETALEKGMSQKIDGEISFELKDDARFLALLERFDKRDWIRHY